MRILYEARLLRSLASLYHIGKANVVAETCPTSKVESRINQVAFIKSAQDPPNWGNFS
jgi:hypothetical protein